MRAESCTLNILVAGAGLAGLGAAISCLLAGHNVHVLEAASEIREVGAGIQVLPNSSRVLQHWGLEEKLSLHWVNPRWCHFNGWRGNRISSMDFDESQSHYPGTWYRCFHRPKLQKTLIHRLEELGGKITCNSKVVDVLISPDGATTTVRTEDGSQWTGDFLIGADGVFGNLTERFLGRPDPPVKTGDLAYRLLLSVPDMMKDPELRPLITDPQINYWLGPDKHIVNYVLNKELFNMVLLVPDDIPEDSLATTVQGNVEEMRSMFKEWDPRIEKLLNLCTSVHKWRLCIRFGDYKWSHPSGSWVMLGDAVHATLPYLAAGAGMAFEDGAVLGECLSRLPNDPKTSKSSKGFLDAKCHALEVFQKCRKDRTHMVIKRSHKQRYLEHMPDGPEQEERDREMQMVPTPPGEAMVWRDPGTAPELLRYDHIADVDKHWGIRSQAMENGALMEARL
ncbi:hypothetical protein N7510_000562 [Penicillium lagena]|uniref:uncharacterized protein n=1 Tax=Penicillium lagena TaxID=94218 RepID=UPI0025426A09|nr:uncharacterized protein N7510_000562 [Penicillium lagena]KAJ5624253.1 hypothetical protein N7510_000562 [Penicillium lagena]